MDDLIENLNNWGADTDSGIRRVMGDTVFYRSLVVRFASSPEFTLLENALEQGDGSEAFRLAHSLKGASANLSLTPFYLAISDLTEDLRKYQASDDADPDVKANVPGGMNRHMNQQEAMISEEHLAGYRKERDMLRTLAAGYL